VVGGLIFSIKKCLNALHGRAQITIEIHHNSLTNLTTINNSFRRINYAYFYENNL